MWFSAPIYRSIGSHKSQRNSWIRHGYIFSQDGHPTFKKESLHPWNLTWNLRLTHQKRKIIFQTSIFRFHVKFQRSIYGYINPYSWAFTDFFARNWVWPMKNLPFSRPFTAIAARLGIFQRGDCWEMGEVIYLDLPFVCIKSWCLFTEKKHATNLGRNFYISRRSRYSRGLWLSKISRSLEHMTGYCRCWMKLAAILRELKGR